ncbi:MAG: hypothetical protein ACU0CO_06100, partial [Shimia sp.]
MLLALDTSGPWLAVGLAPHVAGGSAVQPTETGEDRWIVVEPMTKGQGERLFPLCGELLGGIGAGWRD